MVKSSKAAAFHADANEAPLTTGELEAKIDAALETLLGIVKTSERSYKDTADAITAYVGRLDWASVSYSGRVLSEEEKTERDKIKAARARVKAAAEAKGIQNVSDVWAQIKRHARGEKRKTGARPNEARPARQRYDEEINGLYKFGLRCDEMDEDLCEINAQLAIWLRDIFGHDLSSY